MNETLGCGGGLRVRSLYYPLLGGSVVVGAGVYGMAQAAADPELSTGFTIGWACVAALVLHRLVRVALIELHDGLVVRNVFSTKYLKWSDIEAVTVGSIPGRGYTAAVVFVVKGRRFRRTASATICYSRARSVHICNEVAACAGAHGVSCELDPAELRSRIF